MNPHNTPVENFSQERLSGQDRQEILQEIKQVLTALDRQRAQKITPTKLWKMVTTWVNELNISPREAYRQVVTEKMKRGEKVTKSILDALSLFSDTDLLKAARRLSVMARELDYLQTIDQTTQMTSRTRKKLVN